MTGIICMWSGLIVDIPNGWALCDGTNGTPDLRDRFVVGAPDGIDPGGVGGGAGHKHIVTANTGFFDDEHSHYVTGETTEPVAGDDDVTDVEGDVQEYEVHTHLLDGLAEDAGGLHQHAFFDWTSIVSDVPPFYEILFIMKT